MQDCDNSKFSKVLLVAAPETLANYSDYLEHLVIGLTSESKRVGIVASGNLTMEHVFAMPVESIQYPLINTFLFEKYNYAKLSEFVEKFQPDVIHALSNSNIRVVRKFAEQFSLPFVVNVFSNPTFLTRFEKYGDNCRCVFAGNSYIKKEFEKKHLSLSSRVKRFHYGTFVDEKTACFDDDSILSSIIVVHPVESVNEFRNLFSAVRHLGIDGYEFMLAIIGQGSGEMACRNLVQNMGLSHYINIVGNVKPVRKFIAGADVFLQPWPLKEFDSSIYEAIAAGLAVAVPKCDSDIFPTGDCVCFDHTDELSIYGSLKGLLDNRDKSRSMARQAQLSFGQQSSASSMLDATIDVYSQAVRWSQEKEKSISTASQ